jgi:hypothetical protein
MLPYATVEKASSRSSCRGYSTHFLPPSQKEWVWVWQSPDRLSRLTAAACGPGKIPTVELRLSSLCRQEPSHRIITESCTTKSWQGWVFRDCVRLYHPARAAGFRFFNRGYGKNFEMSLKAMSQTPQRI